MPRTEEDVIKEAELRRQLLGDQILNMIRKVDVSQETIVSDFVKKVALPLLAQFSYSNQSQCQPPLSTKTRTLFRNRLMSAFGHLLPDLQGYTYPCDLLRSCSPDAVDMDAGITTSKDKAIATMDKIIKKIKKSKDEKKAPLQALALLYSLSIFQLYNGEPEAISILGELKLCYDHLIRHKDEEEDVDASEVLVELLLSFISKSSALLRKVTQHVFAAFMSDITAGGLQLMTDVLESGESLRGQQSLFDQEADGQDGDDDNQMDSDVEVADIDGDEGEFEAHPDEEPSGDEEEETKSEDEADKTDDEEAKKLDEALAQALGSHRLDQDAEAASDSDADMTDSEMMALDLKLVEIFSQRKKEPNKKQEQKDAKETVVNFKSRVLDLLDIYVKKQASNALAFALLLPLLRLMRTTKAKPLSDKAHNVIAAFARAARGAKAAGGMQTHALLEVMMEVHREASKDPSHVFARAASTASLLVASTLLRRDRENWKVVSALYRDTVDSMLDPKVHVQAAFFHEWINWCQSQKANVS